MLDHRRLCCLQVAGLRPCRLRACCVIPGRAITCAEGSRDRSKNIRMFANYLQSASENLTKMTAESLWFLILTSLQCCSFTKTRETQANLTYQIPP